MANVNEVVHIIDELLCCKPSNNMQITLQILCQLHDINLVVIFKFNASHNTLSLAHQTPPIILSTQNTTHHKFLEHCIPSTQTSPIISFQILFTKLAFK